MTKDHRDRVLFVSHDASRTGAPILLLGLLRWLKAHGDVDFDVLLSRGGDLESDFAALAPVHLLRPETAKRKPFVWRAARRIGLEGTLRRFQRSSLRRRLITSGYSLVYSNTVTNGEALDLLDGAGCAVLTHVHELESWIRRAGPANFASVKRHTTKWVAVCEAVKRNLVEGHGAPAADVEVIHAFTSLVEWAAIAPRGARAEIRAKLGIPQDAVVVGAMGTTDWRKGADLFVHLARLVRKSPAGARARFVWVGGDAPDGPRHRELEQDLEASGLSGYVQFVPPQTNPRDWFESFDVFALTSREDPYPLVCLEAAVLARPILCFAGSGGEPEFVEDDCGFVVPYLDVEAMAARAAELVASEPLRARLGAAAKAKALARHDISVAAPKILAVMRSLLDRRRGR